MDSNIIVVKQANKKAGSIHAANLVAERTLYLFHFTLFFKILKFCRFLIGWEVLLYLKGISMKTRMVVAITALSLAFVPCDVEAVAKSKGLLEKIRWWGNVNSWGEVSVRSLRRHFNTEQVATINKWLAAGDIKPCYAVIPYLFMPIVSLNDILATSARYDDHVMAERVVKLSVEHNVRFGGLSLDLGEALTNAIENDSIDTVNRMVKIISEQGIETLYSWEVKAVFKFAAKHNSIDIFEHALNMLFVQGKKFSSYDVDDLLEIAAEHNSIDIAEQVLKIAVEQDISLSSWDIASMLETAAKFERDDILKLVAELARKNGIDPDDVYGSGRARPWGADDYVGDPYEVIGISEDASPRDIKKAFRTLIKQYHPDKNSGDKIAEEKAREIISAYKKLRDMGKAD